MEDFVKGTLVLIAAVIVGLIALKIAWWLLQAVWWLLKAVWFVVCLPFSGAFWSGLFEMSCACAEGLVAGICAVVFLIVLAKVFGKMTDWM